MPKGVYIRTDEYRAKQRVANLGHPGWNKGGTVSAERRAKQSAGQMGHPFYGGGGDYSSVPVGTRTLRQCRGGYIFVKTAAPDVWRREHRVVYEAAYGATPAGWCIHHIDGNKTNNTLENLQAMTRSAHMKLHRNA